MRKNLELTIKILAVLSFFVPLVMLPKHFIFPFIVPKILLIRSVTLLMLGAYVVLLAMDWERYRIRLTPTMWAVLLFLASFVVSTFTGVDWYRSFWDNHERMLGLFTIIHYVLYFIILTSVITNKNDWRWLLRLFLLGGAAVMAIAFAQQFNHELFLNRSGDRSAATLGNPIYVGGYGMFLAFLGYLLFTKESEKWWKIYAAIGGFLGFLGIFFSGTRGAFIGLCAGIGLAAFLYLILLKGHKKVRQSILAIFIVGFLALGFLFVNRQETWVRNIPAVGNLLNISLTSGTAETRLMAWKSAIEAWQDKPVLGWGPGNYLYAFNKYYQAEFLEHGWNETWFDNAHNILMNTLAERGAVGIVLYLGMFGTIVYGLWANPKKTKLDLHVKVIGTSFLAAHLAQNNFVFENPTSYLYFFFYLAFLNAETKSEVPGSAQINKVSNPLLIVSFLAILLLIYATNVNPARANMATLKSLRTLYSFENPIEAYSQAVSIPTPHIDDIRNDFARQATALAAGWVQQGKREEMAKVMSFAYNELEKNRELHPLDIRVHIQQAQIAEQGFLLFGDARLLVTAERALQEAMIHSPERQQIKYMLASIKINLGKTDEGIELYKETIEDDPLIGEGWWRWAYILNQNKDTEGAKEVVRQARAAGARFDDRGLGVINEILPPETASSSEAQDKQSESG